ncbi:hypothetical protein RvY_09280 [Ramazzottius varieornatus]|uniref:Uncharacterized protein n=1 Tax=Ramazzottius varieornatus TaxID=947166 RepID=A0A1D1VEB6_RAMVA|nr:hypothetical protein RvY_09280 [Ramazzottius varieornatus]
MASSNPNPRPLRTIRDLRDETWMVREGLAEIEREQVLRRQGPTVRYELSSIPYLGTDGKATQRDLVPHPRKIYEDDSEYIKRCKEGGTERKISFGGSRTFRLLPSLKNRKPLYDQVFRHGQPIPLHYYLTRTKILRRRGSYRPHPMYCLTDMKSGD